MQIKLIFVRGSWASLASFPQAALDLAEETYMLTEAQVRVQHVTLHKIAVVTLRVLPPSGIAESLIALAHFTPQREVPFVFIAQRDVLDRIEVVGAQRGIAQEAPVLLLSQCLIRRTRGRPFRCCGGGRRELCNRLGDVGRLLSQRVNIQYRNQSG